MAIEKPTEGALPKISTHWKLEHSLNIRSFDNFTVSHWFSSSDKIIQIIKIVN